MTALAILVLSESGKLKLDDPISRFLPELKMAVGVTVRHLVHHTAGFPEYSEICKTKKTVRNEDILPFLGKKGAVFRPEERFEYNNTGYALLALIIERASNEKFPAFMESKIFAPLGMTETFVNDRRITVGKNLAWGYSVWPFFAREQSDEVIDCNSIYGDGAIYSNLDDLLLWHRSLDAGTLVSKASLDEAFRSGKTFDGKEIGYGFGWEIEKVDGHRLLKHEGVWGGFRNVAARFAKNDLKIVILGNSDSIPTDALLSKALSVH